MDHFDFTAGRDASATNGASANDANILCCECGVAIQPNPANMCATCLRNHVDITENIPKQAVLHFCRNCERYLQPPNEWIKASLESRELLALCLKKLKNLKEVKLIDATFAWTEPHSKRIKVKLTVHGEVSGGTVLQQVFVVEYTVQNQMCDDCHRTEAKDFWRCLVQVRQRAENKKTFYYLEQLILKHKAHGQTLGIKPLHGGLDFYYSNENHARRMVDFLKSMVPVTVNTSKRLISHDIHSNNYNYKYSWSVEIAPLSKDSAVCLPKKLCQQLGHISPICLINRVSSSIHLIDPATAQIAELTGQVYFRSPFQAIFNPNQLVEYIVLDMEVISEKDRDHYPGQGKLSSKHVLCDVWVVRAVELGVFDNMLHARSHLGHVLKIGDCVLGYNITEANVNDPEFEKLALEDLPDVVLVRKEYDRKTRLYQRVWKLKHLTNEATDERSKHDFVEFLDDLEDEEDLRRQINIYRDMNKVPVDTAEGLVYNIPRISLAEMLEDMTLDSDDDAMGDENDLCESDATETDQNEGKQNEADQNVGKQNDADQNESMESEETQL